MTKMMTALIALLLIGSAEAQDSCAKHTASLSRTFDFKCAGVVASQLIAQATMRQMPGMQPQRSQPNTQKQEQTPPPQQHGMQHMEMRTPETIPSHVSDLQEPENPEQKTGANLPVPDLLSAAKSAPAKNANEFEQLALQNNPTLKQAQALVQNSAGLARQAGLWPNPSVGYQGEQIRGGDFHGGEQGGFIQQDVVLGGKLGLRRNVFEQQRKSDEIGVEEQKLHITGAVRVQFYSALAQLRTVEVRRQLLETALDAAATAHQLANVGQADAPDILQSEVEAEQAKLGFATAQQEYIQSFHQLAALVGEPNMPVALLDGNLERPPEIDADRAVETVTENSPTVKRAEQEAARAEAALRRDKREAIPDLTLRLGEQQNFEQNPITMQAVGAQSFATASIQIPIFNRNQGNVQAAKAELERNQQEVMRVRLDLTRAAQPLVQRYLTNKLQVERYRDQMIPRARRAYELYLQKYRNMASAYPQVIISQRTLFQLKESYVQALAQLWTSAIELQNFLLVDGLSAPRTTGSTSTQVNLPTSGSGASE